MGLKRSLRKSSEREMSGVMVRRCCLCESACNRNMSKWHHIYIFRSEYSNFYSHIHVLYTQLSGAPLYKMSIMNIINHHPKNVSRLLLEQLFRHQYQPNEQKSLRGYTLNFIVSVPTSRFCTFWSIPGQKNVFQDCAPGKRLKCRIFGHVSPPNLRTCQHSNPSTGSGWSLTEVDQLHPQEAGRRSREQCNYLLYRVPPPRRSYIQSLSQLPRRRTLVQLGGHHACMMRKIEMNFYLAGYSASSSFLRWRSLESIC